jgi:hypothetical protein
MAAMSEWPFDSLRSLRAFDLPHALTQLAMSEPHA